MAKHKNVAKKRVVLIWTSLILDIVVIALAVFTSVYWNNPKFLYLLALLVVTGSNYEILEC